MKIILEDGPYSYQVDWAKDPELDEGDVPTVEDCIESFLRLLENIYSPKKIAAYIEGGFEYSASKIIKSLLEVIIFISKFVNDLQAIGPNILLEHCCSCMS